MVKTSSNPSDSGSALILVLLITALLTTIAISFLSTSRVEQIAAKNFSRQNTASGLAELATQQAMGKIQQGFTVTGTGTTVITTQPGAIWQFTFSGGSCSAVAAKNPVELYSTNGTLDANLNNLQNPGNTTANATTNSASITGNASERILIKMEDVTSNGTTIGRVAYYVDDEGTKLNANSATGNRTVLNAGNRPQDISALVSSAGSSFNSIINSASSNTSSITGWSYFFRPEQVGAAVSGISGNHTPFLTASTSSASTTANMSHLLTPWGTQRLEINSLSTNATDGTGNASINQIHAALTNSTLTAIYGGNFSTKYTSAGVKQIAANMLQMRDPNTATVNASFSYNGPLLGTDSLDANGIPQEYLGYAPYPVISEVGFATVLGLETGTPTHWHLKFSIQPTLEIFNPYPYVFSSGNNTRLVLKISSLSFDMDGTNYSMDAGSISLNPDYSGIDLSSDMVGSIPAQGKKQIRIAYKSPFLAGIWEIPKSTPRTINSIGNVTIRVDYIKLLANSSNNAAADQTNTSIRDWISGDEIGQLRSKLFTNLVFPLTLSNSTVAPDTAQRASSNSSAQRIYHLAKKPSTPPLSAQLRYWTSTDTSLPGSFVESTPTWVDPNSTSPGNQGNSTSPENNNSTFASPGNFSSNTIPSDPSLGNSVANAVYASNNASDMREPFLLTGNYTCPSDLGLVPTNQRWRRLRMQMQPAAEGSLIPDWAMLDAISFGNSTNPNNAFNRMLPVNINGMFRLPGNATVAPRTIGIKALAQVLSWNGTSGIQDPTNPASPPATLSTNETTRFKGPTVGTTTITNIANAIGNMTWSANSTWGNATTGKRWKMGGQPIRQYILPSEIMEISGVADAVSQTNYTNNSTHFKRNEGRASAFIPAVTTRSSHFMIYAYSQALDKSGNIDAEALAKSLVEVEITTPATATTSAVYKVKKLYTQPIPLGQ